MIRLVIAEDHQSLVDGLVLQLKSEADIEIVGTCNDGEALLELVKLKVPDVVITDIRMPRIDGITATKMIKKEFPDIRVLAFTMYDQDEAVSQMLASGASGYILKKSSLDTVIEAIRTVYNRNNYFDGNIHIEPGQALKASSSKGILTKRQNEILGLIAQGYTSREIADKLFIGLSTVETHRKNMIRILELKGSGELLRYALDQKYNF